MVSLVVKPSLRAASCCMLLVVKGAGAWRLFSEVFTSLTVNSFPLRAIISFAVFSS